MKTLYKKTVPLLLVLMLVIIQISFSQVLISDGTGNATPNSSAMLDIQSTNKGLLIPRMDSVSRKSIFSPARGLLVFDNDLGNFFIYGTTARGTDGWVDLSSGATVWEQSGDNVYLANSNYNVGIGTSTPNRKLVIKAENKDDTLFEIQDMNGKPLMIITSKLKHLT